MRAVLGVALGIAISIAAIEARERILPTAVEPAPARMSHVPEDASGAIDAIGIHYAPVADDLALPVWRALFAALPPRIDVQVLVAAPGDFARLEMHLAEWETPERARFHAVVADAAISTWSRDRFAAIQGEGGRRAILAPPRIETPFAPRAGDARSPFAFSRALYGTEPRTADFLFEGGDFVSTPRRLFVGASLLRRNVGRGDATKRGLGRAIARQFSQRIVWLGSPGEIPDHHVMMFATPIDDETMVVGDVREGMRLLGASALPVDPDVEGHARRLDRVAARAEGLGMRVVRMPTVVLEGAGAWVTYTNALFDREGPRRIVYLPTYRLPALDDTARRTWEAQGFVVRPIDVSTVYRQNGSLGCLVNVLGRQPV